MTSKINIGAFMSSVKDLFLGTMDVFRNNLEYLKPLRVLNSIKLLKLHKAYYAQAKKKYNSNHDSKNNLNKDRLVKDGCFIESQILTEDIVSKLLSNLDDPNVRYEYSGEQKSELMLENSNPVLPDYKVISVPSMAPGVDELLKSIYLPLVAPIESAYGCHMRPISIWIYRTYGRSLDNLKNKGDYGSFKLHFDNSGILNTFKVMCYLSDVTEYATGPLEIVKGSHKLTKLFLPALGGSRIPESFVDKYEHFSWYGKKGDGLTFNVKAVHRGGRTAVGIREVVTVELVPSFLEYNHYIEKFKLSGGDHFRGRPYTTLRENPYQNSN
jgi:hypothetical protein